MNLAILFLNVVGTFLISAEAIKVENLRILAKIFNIGSISLNPPIEFVDGDDDISVNITSPSHSYKSAIFIPIVTITIFSVLSFFLLKISAPNLGLLLKLIISFFCGAILWTLVIYLFKAIVLLLSFIERILSRGIIGIIGFLVLVVSFVMQYFT